jgi:hypothetical protein
MTAPLARTARLLATAALLIGALVLAASSSAAEPASSWAPQLGPAPSIAPRPAPPTAAEIASAYDPRVAASRKVKVKTSDRAPGGLLEVDISWSGRGPYSGKVYGSVQDLEADGYCVGAWVFNGGDANPSLTGARHACPAGSVVPAYYSYKKRWRVLVQVCLEKGYRLYYCSGWK